MDRQIDSRFERVERSLAALIESISKYNPSTAHAAELVTAEEELAKGLEDGLLSGLRCLVERRPFLTVV